MKKLLSLIMTGLFLLVSCPMPLAAQTPQDELASVTQRVKDRLHIGDQYTQFQGEVQEDVMGRYWNLSWSNEAGDALWIQADTQGKILQYNRTLGEESTLRYDGAFAPAFPELSPEEARERAQDFLDTVLEGPLETFAFAETGIPAEPRKNGNTYFYGTIRLKGLDSPIEASISLSGLDKQVRSFYRSDRRTRYLGGIPSEKPAASQIDAAALLKDTLKLKIEYVLERDPETGKEKAFLRYLPVYSGNPMVDAQTGQLVDIDALYREIHENPEDSLMEAAADSAKGAGLTPQEQAGIEKIAGILDSKVLDSKVRAMTELGLEGYTMADARYYYYKEEDRYTCSLTYAKPEGEGDGLRIRRKYAQMDAKTGLLESFSSSGWYEKVSEETATIPEGEALNKAQSFLAKYFKANYAQMKLYSSDDPNRIMPLERSGRQDYSFTFAQRKNGYFFPSNAYYVSIDPENGTINSFSGYYREVEFDSAEGLVSMAKAVDQYFKTQETTLAYLQVPKKLDLSSPEMEPYIEWGLSYLYELRLGYSLTSEKLPWAIDAKTGEPLYSPDYGRQKLSYEDLSGDTAEILKLAEYGIGYAGGSFRPSKTLTQLDMVALLVSADGYLVDPSDEESLKSMYERAYQLGILKRAQREDERQITRMELVKTILTMAGYDKTAELPGIFTCSYADKAAFAPADFGYAAIAQGLGLVKPADGYFQPQAIATRQQAAVVLFNFMSR